MTDEEIMAMYWYMLRPVSFRFNSGTRFDGTYELNSNQEWVSAARTVVVPDSNNRWYVFLHPAYANFVVIVNGVVDSASADVHASFRSIDCAMNPKNISGWEIKNRMLWEPSPNTSMVDLTY
jgi:hypothetical protein